MNRYIFVVFGAIYLLIGSVSERVFVVTYFLLGVYIIMFLIGLFLTIKYRAVNPLVLLLVTLFMVLYTLFTWDGLIVYHADGIHSLVGIFSIAYGVFFAKKN
ncbi:MAG: hypothetical protein ACVCEJ_02275 [Candidatus Izemoplasmataceae bacterium]